MCNEMDIFKNQYKQEIYLIKANGNDKSALRLRYKQYRIHDRELMKYITHRSLEQAGRKAALKHMVKEIEKQRQD